MLAGPLLDTAPYPINAARYLFEAEPTEIVSAVMTRHRASGFRVRGGRRRHCCGEASLSVR